jgi:Subtilase family/FG-GAP-like repeat
MTEFKNDSQPRNRSENPSQNRSQNSTVRQRLKQIALIVTAVAGLISTVMFGPAFASGGDTARRFVVKLTTGADLRMALGIASAFPEPGESALAAGIEFRRPAIALQQPSRRANSRLNRGGASPVNPLERILVVIASDSSVTTAQITALLGQSNIEYVEVDPLLELFALPTDEYFPDQWHLLNDGQLYLAIERVDGVENDTLKRESGVAGEDIGLRDYYANPSPVRKRPLVGVIDTGVDGEHPELAGKIWRNPDEIPDNGLDDDHNGLIDDVSGFDFSGDSALISGQITDNDPSDSVGHGSHVAGIIAAASDGVGVVGVAPEAEILPVKIFPNAFGSVGAEAVVYAVNSGADILNISWGTRFPSQLLVEAFAYARAQGVFVAVASGNSGDNSRFQPADLPTVFTVGATNSAGKVTFFSTYGAHVDIVAPGRDILSIRGAGTDMFADGGEPGVRIIDSLYYLSDGTSMSTPIVAGAAARLLSARPELSVLELESALRDGARDIVQPFDTGAQFPGPDSLSGAGFLDIGLSLAIVSGAGLAFGAPEAFSRQSAAFPIIGLPIENYTGAWSLDFALTSSVAPGDSVVFLPLAGGVLFPVDSVLALYEDSLPGGRISFRLTDERGHETFLPVTVARESVALIVAPVDGDTLQSIVEVVGSASSETYDSVVVGFTSQSNPLETFVFSSTAEFYNSSLFIWDLNALEPGSYTLHLRAHSASGIAEDSSQVEVLSALSPGWPVQLPDFIAVSPVAADLDQDGFKEIIIGTRSGLYAYDYQGQLLTGFPVSTDRDCRSVATVHDISGDGFLDIVFTSDSGLHVVDRNGGDVAGFPVTDVTGQVFLGFPTPIVTDLANDREPAIMFVNSIGQLRAYTFSGVSYFYSLSGLFTRIDPNINNNFVFKGLSIPQVTPVDLNLDGRLELLSAYSSPGATSGAFAFNARDGQPANGRISARVLSVGQSHGMALGDVDGNGILDVLLSGQEDGGDMSIWLLSDGVESAPGWPISIPAVNDWIGAYPTLADLDGDDIPEALAVFTEFDISKVFIFSLDGSPFVDSGAGLLGEILEVDVSLSSLSVSDIDGDGVADIVARSGFVFPGTGFERIYAFTPEGRMLDGYPLVTPARPFTVTSTGFVPLLDDIDNDGLLEIVLAGSDKLVSVWDTKGNAAENRWDWRRFLHDSSNHGTGGLNPGSSERVESSGVRKAGSK